MNTIRQNTIIFCLDFMRPSPTFNNVYLMPVPKLLALYAKICNTCHGYCIRADSKTCNFIYNET